MTRRQRAELVTRLKHKVEYEWELKGDDCWVMSGVLS